MTSVDEVLELYERWGDHRYDEELGQLQHALQTAALAEAAGASDATVVAALLHDVGHLLHLRGDPPVPHERSGPAFLTGCFPPEVVSPIALHVEAKRYLCAVDPDHHARLSPGSAASLRRQGGPMSVADIETFRSTEGWQEAVSLRRWDDSGKVVGLAVPDLDHFEPFVRSVASPSTDRG
jgi:predicted HD phosphohydrolase